MFKFKVGDKVKCFYKSGIVFSGVIKENGSAGRDLVLVTKVLKKKETGYVRGGRTFWVPREIMKKV